MARVRTLLVSFSVLLGTVVASWHPGQASESLSVEAPTLQVGDEWRFVGGRFPEMMRVVEVNDDHVIMSYEGDTLCQGCRWVRDKNLTTVRVLDAQGNPAAAGLTPSIGMRQLDFPLHVGKEWSQDIHLVLQGIGTRPYRMQYRVEAYEDVTVKAGTFKAFRITQRTEDMGSNARWRGTRRYWWSPELKWFVKMEAYRPGGGRDIELQRYTVK